MIGRPFCPPNAAHNTKRERRRTTPTASRRAALAGLAAALAALMVATGARPAAAQTAAIAATQAPGFYRFKVGGFTVTTVHDGYFQRPLQGFIRNAPLEEVQKVLAESFLPTDVFRIPFTLTVLDTGRQLIVFDSGNGVMPPGAT